MKLWPTQRFSPGFGKPLTRSSHHAGDDFARLKAARDRQLKGRSESNAQVRDHPKLFDTSRRTCLHLLQMLRGIRFLPLCEALKVTSTRERDGKTLLIANMTVGYKAIRETFTSQVMLDPDALKIDVQYLDGPFRYLEQHLAI